MWRYHNPVDVHFGAGALKELPRVLGGRKAVLVTFPEAAGFGLTKRVQELLGTSLLGVISDTQPNPDVANLTTLYERFWRDYHQCDVVIGIGGGSTLDTAKALMIGTASGKLDELVALLATGAPFTPARVKRLIAIPTTAGTGSEVTPFATIWDAAPDRRKKYSLMLAETWAQAAIVDPELTLSLPPTVTLHSALDALSHSLEAIWNVNANPVSDVLAVAAAREILARLPPLMARPGDIELRTNVAWAALTAGLAFSNTKTALAHSISYEMTLK
ncbi:MAG TPA: iron-containing alcohol dehydrogenase, partial [Burkholderiales bacterium]|nr:iron-containing alcohol dehydrogenase [Burkholderiales bacterium]